MKSTVYIHPGLPKTGTTAIQIFLRDNAEALERKGVAYPLFPRKFQGVRIERNGHFLSRAVEDLDFKKACFQEIIDLADTFNKIILTDEELWHWACDRTEFWSALKEELAKYDIDVKMIVYLRRQDAFASSLWAQKIKGVKFRTYTFKNFIKDDLYDVNYYEYLQRVSAVIGKENVIVRPYEFSQFLGKDNSIVSDFLNALDIEYDDSLIFQNERLNLSLGGNVLEVKRQMNRVAAFRPNAWKTLSYYFEVEKEWIQKKKYHDCSTWLSGERVEYMKRFEDGNRKIALEYLGRLDGVLFEDSLPTNDPAVYCYTCRELRSILKCLQKKLLEDPNAPFSPEDFKKICGKTWEHIYADDSYVHRCPIFRKINRKIRRLLNPNTK